MNFNRESPASSESQTPTFPPSVEGSGSGTPGSGQGGMTPGMMNNPYLNMYNWLGGMMSGGAGMGMGGINPAMMGMGMGMGGMPPAMMGMGGMMGGMQGSAGSGGSRRRPPPADNVYRPFIDESPSDTVPETQFTGNEMLSLEEMGLSPIRETGDAEEPPARPRGTARARDKGKAPGSSSQAVEDDTRRTIWSVWENVALAKAWIGVVEDPYVGANQYIDRMWHRIRDAYLVAKPAGAKVRTSEQCRKQWERLRPKLSRFAGLYQNNLRQASSGMSEQDVRARTYAQFPDRALKFRDFDQWEAFLVVKDSPKFLAGVETGWPKRTKINASGEYSSSAGSHDLPDTDEVSPIPLADTRRRRRPTGQKAAQRAARAGTSGPRSFEVHSEAPPPVAEYDRLAIAQMTTTLVKTMHRWHSTTDPVYKRMLKDVIDQTRRTLGWRPIGDDGVEIGSGDEAGGMAGGNFGGAGGGMGDGGDDDETE